MILAFIVSLVGFICLYLEFFMPGAIVGILGALLLGGGMFLFAWENIGIWWDLLYLGVTAFLAIFTCKFAVWRLKKSRKNEFFLSQDQAGYSAVAFDQTLIGQVGEAASDLKPAGHILVDGKHVQALSQSGYIAKGTPLLIKGGQGAHLIVEEKKS